MGRTKSKNKRQAKPIRSAPASAVHTVPTPTPSTQRPFTDTAALGEPTGISASFKLLVVGSFLFCSGFCALMFQVYWMRELRLIFGATTLASAAVLAVFMGGLGIGNAIFGYRLDRSTNPLRAYGKLELGISLSTLLTPLWIGIAAAIYISLGGQLALQSHWATLLRIGFAILIMGVPTILMGGTLPAAAGAIARADDPNRSRIALVYGLNTLGAVLGAGVSNFFLLEYWGSLGTLLFACSLNLLLALGALWFSRYTAVPAASATYPSQLGELSDPLAEETIRPVHNASEPDAEADEPLTARSAAAPASWVWLSAWFLGFAFFLMELVWFRMLGPLLGGTTYTFGLILALALLGIGIGGTLYHFLSRNFTPSMLLFAFTCSLEGLFLALPLAFADDLAVWAALLPLDFKHYLQIQFPGGDPISPFVQQLLVWGLVAGIIVFPSAMISGFQFPLLIALVGQGREHAPRDVGITFAANTLGAIVGSLLGGFVLLPVLTAPGAWQLVAILLALLGAGAAAWSRGTSRKLRLLGAGFCLIVAAWSSIQPGPTAVWRHSGIGAGRNQNLAPLTLTQLQDWKHMQRHQVLQEFEGVESSVAIIANEGLAFIVNGKSDGNATHDAGTQMGLGLVGPILHPNPKRGIVIGLGTGETAGWLAAMPTLEQVEVIELEPSVLVMAQACRSINQEVLTNSKVQVHINDAREFLLTYQQQVDLIISEPSNPYRAGIASLYTLDFYLAARNRLQQGGLFLQWLQTYEVHPTTVYTVLRTFRAAFGHVEIWRTRTGDMLLVGSTEAKPAPIPEAVFRQRVATSPLKEGLCYAWQTIDLEGALAHYVCGTDTVEELLYVYAYELHMNRLLEAGKKESELPSFAAQRAQMGNNPQELWRIIPVNTDDRNLLEFAFAKSVGNEVEFSVDNMLALAIALKDDLPRGSEQYINRDLLGIRRVAMSFLYGLAPKPDPNNWSPAELQQFNAFQEAAQDLPERALHYFKESDIDQYDPIQSRMYSQAMASLGKPLPAALLAKVALVSDFDAALLQLLSDWNRKERQQMGQRILATVDLLQTDPWSTIELFDDLLPLIKVIGQQDPEFLQAIHQRFQKPFMMYRHEETRLLTLLALSEALPAAQADRAIVEALRQLEPDVPFREDVLGIRAETYKKMRDPLVDRAIRDWKWFQVMKEVKVRSYK